MQVFCYIVNVQYLIPQVFRWSAKTYFLKQNCKLLRMFISKYNILNGERRTVYDFKNV